MLVMKMFFPVLGNDQGQDRFLYKPLHYVNITDKNISDANNNLGIPVIVWHFLKICENFAIRAVLRPILSHKNTKTTIYGRCS